MHKTHGRTKTPTYRSWLHMKERCKPNHQAHHLYADRGIEVCERWLNSFENFLADMGERPPNTSIDRYPDPDGPYSPDNCRWADREEQSANSRKPKLITYLGETHSIIGWSRLKGINRQTLQRRLRDGWPLSRALSPDNYTPKIMLTYNGETKSLPQWARDLNIDRGALFWRYQQDWPIEYMLDPSPRHGSRYEAVPR